MMRCLRDVNVDNNTVGWYQSTYFSSFIEESCIETQFNYQQHIKTAVLLVYDPARTRATGMPLRAFRLTDHFMALYGEGKFTLHAVAAAKAVEHEQPHTPRPKGKRHRDHFLSERRGILQ